MFLPPRPEAFLPPSTDASNKDKAREREEREKMFGEREKEEKKKKKHKAVNDIRRENGEVKQPVKGGRSRSSSFPG